LGQYLLREEFVYWFEDNDLEIRRLAGSNRNFVWSHVSAGMDFQYNWNTRWQVHSGVLFHFGWNKLGTSNINPNAFSMQIGVRRYL
jgi:hypothetical protein